MPEATKRLPLILFDQGEEWEEFAYVEVSPAVRSERQAKRLLRRECADWIEPGVSLYAEGQATLRAKAEAPADEWWFDHCADDDPDARSFWRVGMCERRVSLYRGWSRFRFDLRWVRRHPKGSPSRHQAWRILRDNLKPYTYRRWRQRRLIRRRKQERAATNAQ